MSSQESFGVEPEQEPIAIVKIYDRGGLYSTHSENYSIETEVVGHQSAANLERIHLVARAAELGLTVQDRDRLYDLISEIRHAIGEVRYPGGLGTDELTILARLEAIGNTVSAARESLAVLAERRVRRAETRAKGKEAKS